MYRVKLSLLYICLNVIFLVLFLSCVLENATRIKVRSESLYTDSTNFDEAYAAALSTGDYAAAITILNRLDLSPAAQAEQIETIIKLLEHDYETAWSTSNISKISSLQGSLQNLGSPRLRLKSEYNWNLFQYFIANRYDTSAVLYAQDQLEKGSFPQANIAEAQEFLSIQDSGLSADKSSKNFWQDRIEATVTVIVDLEAASFQGVHLANKAIGSGFFIDKQGYIVTNYHVIAEKVEGSSNARISIKLANSTKLYPTKLIGWDKDRDLALLKAPIKPSKILEFERGADDIFVGNNVFAIGSPGGLESTLTSGTISSTNRSLLPLTNVIQVDVAVNHGNSGGPLLNELGRVIGVIFAKSDQEFEGINFAIPVHTLVSRLATMYKGEEVRNSWLGLILNNNINSGQAQIYIHYLFPQSPSYLAGLQAGDIIESINGQTFNDIYSMQDYISSLPANSIVKLQYKRDSISQTMYIGTKERLEDPMEYIFTIESKTKLFYVFFGAELEVIRYDRLYRVKSVQPYSISDDNKIASQDVLKFVGWLRDATGTGLGVLLRLERRSAGYTDNHLLLVSPIQNTNIV